MNHNTLFAAMLAASLLLSACTVDGFEQTATSLTVEESLIAGQIIGEFVSEDQEGLLSSFSEAFAIPTPTGLHDGPSALVSGGFRKLENYTYGFNSETGEHTASFDKEVVTDLSSSQTKYVLHYTFFDASGDIIEFPDDQRNRIESVDFRADRSGEIDGASKRSIYTRTDRLSIYGLSDAGDFLSIDGFHSGEGIFTQIRNDGTQFEREYFLGLNYLDIRINKPLVLRNRNFRRGVNGAFSYEKTIRQTGNDRGLQGTKIVNGTVELNGDGTALLKFREPFDAYRFRLANGDLFDDEEFEGRVSNVNLLEQIFTLSNGQRIQINEQTEIEFEDFNSLAEVALAVENGVRVVAEGDYYHVDENVNLWIATEVEFELEVNEFEGLVVSVDHVENSFTLINGDLFFITDSSEIEFIEDVDSLLDVSEAVEEGMPVIAAGDFYFDSETGTRIVKEAEFVFDFAEFDESIISADTNESTFTLESGKVVLITENTVIDEDGDYITLEEVTVALNENEEVGAEGTFYFSPLTGFWNAVEIEFFD